MRTSRHRRRENKNTSCLNIAHKTKRQRKIYSSSFVMTDSLMQNKSRNDLEDINEVLRTHKSHMAEGREFWKVMPKDSCEVYKKRQDKDKRQSDTKTDENDVTVKRGTRRSWTRKGGRKVKVNTRKRRTRNVSPSLSSNTTCTNTTNDSSTCTSHSEMEYD